MFKKALMLCLLLLSSIVNAATASFYHDKFENRITASGQVFKQHKMTCASNTHKMGTKLLVINPSNNKRVIVTVNDKGNLYGRTLDLSKSAFKQIANTEQGVVDIVIKKLP